MNRIHKVLITLAALVLLLTACVAVAAPEPAAAIPEVTIMAHDYSFEAPAEIPAGLVRVKLMDHGKEPHHVQFARLNDGVSFEQFTAALQEGEGPAMALITFPGGVAPVDPGSSASGVINLTPGNYVLLCFVPSADGLPHLAKGMVAPVTVVESATEQVEPVADATVQLVDFSFVLPTDIKAGKQIWKVVNEGSQLHEINLMKLAEGKTLDDVAAWWQNPKAPRPSPTLVATMPWMPRRSAGWISISPLVKMSPSATSPTRPAASPMRRSAWCCPSW